MARIYGMLGNIDANTGDAQTGNGPYSPIALYSCFVWFNSQVSTFEEWIASLSKLIFYILYSTCLGWDTDQFLIDISEENLTMLTVRM